MAFRLSFEPTHRVVRATATGVISTQDLLDLDRELITFLAREETPDRSPVRGLFDFSEATAVAVPETMAVQRASQPAVVRGQRVMVPSRRAGCSIVECFMDSQRLAGTSSLAMAGSIPEAHALLGMDAARYEGIE